MIHRLRLVIAYIADSIDDKLLVHGERFERVPFLWRIPSCKWAGNLWPDSDSWYSE